MEVLAQMGRMPGFVSWLGAIVGGRMFTATAWADAEAPARLLREGAHKSAMGLFFADGVGTAVHTSVWAVQHQNPLWVRCPACGQVAKWQGEGSACGCGQPLPTAPPYW
jgi:hypothetical protein